MPYGTAQKRAQRNRSPGCQTVQRTRGFLRVKPGYVLEGSFIVANWQWL